MTRPAARSRGAPLARRRDALRLGPALGVCARGGEGVLRVQAVPNQMQFAPAELRVRAGQPVRLVFENPDLMPHNLLLTAPDAAEEVGALVDAMAAEPGALARHYVPTSPRILHATPWSSRANAPNSCSRRRPLRAGILICVLFPAIGG